MKELKEIGAKFVKGVWSTEESIGAKFNSISISEDFIEIHLETRGKWEKLDGGGSDKFGEYFSINEKLTMFIPEKYIEEWKIDTFAYSRTEKYDMWILFMRNTE